MAILHFRLLVFIRNHNIPSKWPPPKLWNLCCLTQSHFSWFETLQNIYNTFTMQLIQGLGWVFIVPSPLREQHPWCSISHMKHRIKMKHILFYGYLYTNSIQCLQYILALTIKQEGIINFHGQPFPTWPPLAQSASTIPWLTLWIGFRAWDSSGIEGNLDLVGTLLLVPPIK